MDLSALLAREGIQADDADALVAWARQRAAALVAHIEPDSALAQQLGAALEHARSGSPAAAVDVPVPMLRQSSRSAPRPISRSVSRPYLGAAVQAALTRNEPALERALETAELEISIEEPAPAPAPEPEEPAPVVADDEDASIGGFNRFAFSLRRRTVETPVEQTPPPRARSFELPDEHSSDSAASWQASELELPAPPGFETRPDRDVPADRSDAESSGLVVGIPDEEGIDIPVPRARSRSAAASGPASAAVSGPASAAVSGPASAAVSGPHAEAQASFSSEALELDSATLALDSLDLDVPESPVRETTRPQPMGRPNSSPHRASPPPPPPHRAASGPLPASSQSGPIAARPPSAPQPAAAPQPASRGRSKTSTAEQKQVAKPEPKAAANKRGSKGRKKVVELSVPVAAPVAAPVVVAAPRKASIGNHQPTGEPSSPGREIPAYLQDDDE